MWETQWQTQRNNADLDCLHQEGSCVFSAPPPQDSLPDAGEAINDFWSMSGIFIYRHHVEPRVKLYVLRKESFPIPLKYIVVTRTTYTSLDVLLVKNIEDCRNVGGEKELSDAWTGFTRFIILNEKPFDGYTWSGRRLARKQTTSRPDNAWPDTWKPMSDASKTQRQANPSHPCHEVEVCRRK